MSIGKRIKEIRFSKKINQVDLSRLVGATQAAISRYESDQQYPGGEFLSKLAEVMCVNINWLLTGDGPMFQELQPINIGSGEFVRLPVSAKIAAGHPIEALDEEPEEWIRVSRDLLSLPPPYYVFKVEGDSMAPFILEGDYVVLSRNWHGVHLQGKICGFRTWDGITLKKLMLQSKGKVAWLMPINHSKYEPVAYSKDTEDLSMLGVLVVLIRKF